MKWRSPRVLIPLILVLVLLVGGGVLLALRLNSSRSPNPGNTLSAYPPDVVTVPPLPTPGPARTTYTNRQFGYRIQFPTDWPLKASADGSLVHIFNVLDRGYPEAVAFDIHCFANPNQLTAKSWWQHRAGASSGEQGIGLLTLTSGAVAFVSIGHGQTAYTVYTLAHNQVACEITTRETDQANAQIIRAAVNTFTWQ